MKSPQETTLTTYVDLDETGNAGADGKISSTKEFVFSNWSEAANTDLEGLKDAFDSNKDGVFDNQDTCFSEFRIW
ncbi:hypothetical protein [Abyssogena phaseoliformis symbiont]|uniref:hypothetical protein n=1 Tax=Abyssogena phaseoliformis symbiont TaxID=596095 RepID=UPI001915A104|nr:hypothetical protein [Abyssogena phaseoliformis symbiont]